MMGIQQFVQSHAALATPMPCNTSPDRRSEKSLISLNKSRSRNPWRSAQAVAIYAGREFLAREEMVGAVGFEPTTFWSQTRRATKLRYAPMTVAEYPTTPPLCNDNLISVSCFVTSDF